MKFGYFCNTTNWNKKSYTQLLDETREITEYCDQNNWDSIWESTSPQGRPEISLTIGGPKPRF